MNKMRVGRELRSLNNMIRRYFEFSSHRKEIETVTGNNGWIISFVADRAGQDIYPVSYTHLTLPTIYSV